MLNKWGENVASYVTIVNKIYPQSGVPPAVQ